MGPIIRAITFDSPCRRHLANVSVDISTRRTQAATHGQTRHSRRPRWWPTTNQMLTMRPNKQKWQDDGPVAICRLLDPAAGRNDDNCFIDRHLPVEWGEEAVHRFVFKANEQSLVSPPVIDSRVLLKQTSGGATGCSSLERPFKGNWLCGRWVMSLNVAIGWSVIRRILQVSTSTFERLNTLAEHDLFNLPLHLTLNHLNSQIVVKSLNLNIQLMIIIQVAADQFEKKNVERAHFSASHAT